jgi:Glycosyltransferase family 87
LNSPPLLRLRLAASTIFSRPALYWALAAVFAARVGVLTAAGLRRPDAEGMLVGSRMYLADPQHLYTAAAAYLAQHGVIAQPGTLDAYVLPPPVALLGLPFTFLPDNIAVQAWTLVNGAALIAGLYLLYRVIGPMHPLAKPVFWLVAAYFQPLFADIGAGQRGGIALLCTAGSMLLEPSRPWLAGGVAGLSAALKYYPAALIIGPRPDHRIRYAVAVGVVVVAVTALTFIPLGIGGAVFYVQHVLLPSLASHNSDCAYDSVRTLFTRVVGGEPFLVITNAGVVQETSPVHLPTVALLLSYLSAIAFAAGAVFGAWRSGWNPPYGMALGFSLGALIPNEVWPYQWLPLLPLVLLLCVRAIERHRIRTLIVVGVLLLGFYRQPCDLPFPNLWTLAAIGLFIVGVAESQLFRSEASASDLSKT